MAPPSIASAASSALASTRFSALVQSILKAASENEGATLEQFLETGSIFQPEDSRLGGTLAFGHVSGVEGKEWSKGSDSVVHSHNEHTIYVGIDRQEVMREVTNLEPLYHRVDTGVTDAIAQLGSQSESERWKTFHQACEGVMKTVDADQSVGPVAKDTMRAEAYDRLGEGASDHISSLWVKQYYIACRDHQTTEIFKVMGRTQEEGFKRALCGLVTENTCKVSKKEVEMLKFTGVDFGIKALYKII